MHHPSQGLKPKDWAGTRFINAFTGVLYLWGRHRDAYLEFGVDMPGKDQGLSLCMGQPQNGNLDEVGALQRRKSARGPAPNMFPSCAVAHMWVVGWYSTLKGIHEHGMKKPPGSM